MALNTSAHNISHYMKMALSVHLLRLAKIDGKFDEDEKRFWFEKIREFGLSIGEQIRCVEISRQGDDPFKLQDLVLPETKQNWLSILTKMMRVDNLEDKREREYIYKVAKDLNINEIEL